jgi:hypothetical protein
MKTLVKLCAVAVLSTVLTSFDAKNTVLTLDEAIAQNKVQATVLPFGEEGYTEGVRVNVKNISGKQIKLKMPKGTIFIPDNGEEQTLITSGDEVFALNKDQQKLIVRKGFCTELSDHGSDDESTFRLGFSTSENLLNVIAYMDSLKVTDEDLIQHAVWCITDGHPVAYARTDDTATSRLVQQRICALTNQQMPWYNTNSAITRTPQREYVVEAKEIAGDLSFKSSVPVELQGMVKDSTGKVIAMSPNKMRCPGGNVTFEYKLTVRGWEKGKYSVVYTNNGVEVINQPFEI